MPRPPVARTATKKTAAPPNGTAAPAPATITLPRFRSVEIEVPILGTAPYISNQWSQKAKQAMADKQQGKARVKKPPKDPEADFQASIYRLADGRPGIPSAAFKAACVNGARYFDGLTQVFLKELITVLGEGPMFLVPIIGPDPEMVEHTVRNETGVADLRYRAMFHDWRVRLTIQYIPQIISPDSILALLDAGGRGGVGEWRPSAPKSKTGQYGTFRVEDEEMG